MFCAEAASAHCVDELSRNVPPQVIIADSSNFEALQARFQQKFLQLRMKSVRNSGVPESIPTSSDGSPLPYARDLNTVLEFMRDPTRFFEAMQRLEIIAHQKREEILHTSGTPPEAAILMDEVLRDVEVRHGFAMPKEVKEYLKGGSFNDILLSGAPLDDVMLEEKKISDQIPGHGRYGHRLQWAAIALEIDAHPELFSPGLRAVDLYKSIGEIDSREKETLDWSQTGIKATKSTSLWTAMLDQGESSHSFCSPNTLMSFHSFWPSLPLR